MPIFVATRLGDLNELVPNLRVYRDAWAAAGHAGNGKVYLRVPVYIAETEQQAREEPMESVMFFYDISANGSRPRPRMEGARAIENRAERGQRLQTHRLRRSDEQQDHRRHARHGGRPAAPLKEDLGLYGILAELNCGMRIPHERVVNSLQPDVPGGAAEVPGLTAIAGARITNEANARNQRRGTVQETTREPVTGAYSPCVAGIS